MFLDPKWRPPEDDATILNERTWLAGIILSAVAYGIVVTLSIMSFIQLIRTTTRSNICIKVPLLVYIFVIFTLGTLVIGAGSKFTQMSFIDYRMIPGGPAAFEEGQFSNPVDMIATVAYVLANWFADGMVVYRCMIIFRGCRYSAWLVMSIPLITYLGSIASGILWLVQVSSTSPWVAGGINFTDPYYWLSLALNISMTFAICARLLYYRRRVMSVLGNEHGSHYTSVASMLVESAALYSAFSLCFLIPFALNNAIQNTFIQMLGEVQIIAPLLIIYRVAYGKAWTHNTNRDLFTKSDHHGQTVRVQFRGPSSTYDTVDQSTSTFGTSNRGQVGEEQEKERS